ncbi:hypothetical protein [Carnobacterium maltaromaticum]|uniref:hypothetical protein n=1 Tax=Carnobacterium maltaromaticum TaxID=2751 RepID=UPI0009C8D4D2|nr:hypothetical protein [Carnobacterium maltaromaticum]GED49152.1 hypothetical protein CMA01_15620 [Carnobacterium maltaromaticum]CRH22660.1 hypothetical protein BN1423_430006 [Carnobacterium maltaromaticum]
MDFIFLSTTAKKGYTYKRLPDKLINSEIMENFLFNNLEELKRFVNEYSFQESEVFFADIENKQGFVLYDEIKKLTNNQVLPYKANDVTLEAIDLLVLHNEKLCITGKNILIFGTGNLSSKLAIRLAERNANVYIWSKNEKKAQKIIEGINLFLPKGSPKIELFKKAIKYEIAISFISANRIIDSSFLSFFKTNALVIDGGIGNFTIDFIRKSEEKKIRMLRLDVKHANGYLEYLLNSYVNMNFQEQIGRKEVLELGLSIVSGGFIGYKGEIIVNNLIKPSEIIGLADGLGGVLDEKLYSREERRRLEHFNEYISAFR